LSTAILLDEQLRAFYDEVKAIADASFRFQDETAEFEYASDLACQVGVSYI
jgi:hypothetical protein